MRSAPSLKTLTISAFLLCNALQSYEVSAIRNIQDAKATDKPLVPQPTKSTKFSLFGN
jgi:hypothetical protein